VAGDGVITLAQAAALVGRPIVPLPMAAAGLLGGLVKRAGLADFSADQMEFLAHGRGLDTTRMRQVLHFRPTHTTRQAFVDYANHLGAPVPGGPVVGEVASSAVSAIGHVVTTGRTD
ncbi:MAG: epimerase, partial [Lapillicoccus sp.]